jgi:hypothetical protein
MKKREKSIETSKTKEGTFYQRNLRRERESERGMTAFVFHKICFGGYHDSAFKIELFETLFAGFSNKSMSIRKTLNMPAFSGSIWSPLVAVLTN